MHSKTPPAMLLSLLLVAASEPRLLTLSPSLDLKLDSPPECAGATDVVAAVDALVRTAPAEPLQVRAKIARLARGYALEATFGGGQREVQGETCEAVIQALVAITALAIDPSVRLSVAGYPELDAAPLGQSRDGAVAELPGQPAAVDLGRGRQSPQFGLRARDAVAFSARDRRQRESSLVLGASLLALGEWGALPEPSYGAAGYLRASLGLFRAELGGSWLRPRWVQVPEVAERKGGYVSWFAVHGNGCRLFGNSVAGCGGLELGQMTGTGQGVSKEDTGRALWLAAALTALGRLPLGGGLSLEGRATAAFPLYRPEFSLEPYGALHRANWLSGRLSLGIGFR